MRQAIDVMLLEGGYDRSVIVQMMRGLRREGWLPDPSLLPDGWLKKRYENQRGAPSYQYLTPDNQKLQGLTSVIEHMEADEEYSDEDVNR